MSIKNKIDENYWKILNAALELDVKKGHLKWTLSDLSRKSGITRSLIYYYFGRSKAKILNEAVKLIGSELAGLTSEREELWNMGDFVSSMNKARKTYENAPYLCLFFLEHLQGSSELSDELRKIEKEFLKKIERHYKIENPSVRNAIFGIYFGMLFAPHQDASTYEVVLTEIKKILFKNN
ncbi:MAG: TetR/AcrR family transcriptional regulator [Bdellovibrionaceae bacterium]|nr:TetR/AcrR family transcriptional regulator [Pseudobdellovibrionaceae bacterium]